MRRIVTYSSLALLVAVWVLNGLFFDGERSPLQAARIEKGAVPEIGEVEVLETVGPDDEEVVEWARDRYREARLSLPPIRVSFHISSDPCEGARGGHLIENDVSRVLICIAELGSSRELKVKRTLLHEFAHAWDAHYLTQDIRDKFIELRGFEGWSFEVPYEERGSEHAAETITWGLIDEPILFGSFDAVTPWEVRFNGYVILTGIEPPHGYVWSLFAASHDIYAYTPSQVEIVKRAWELSEDESRLTEWIEVRFKKDTQSCKGAVVSSELIGDRLHIQLCPGSESELTDALLTTLTGG